VALETPVPLRIAYFTTWVDADGSVLFAPDVYRHDVAQERLLPRPRPADTPSSSRSQSIAARGNHTSKQLPPPSRGSARASPPWRRAICRTSERPSPAPPADVLPAGR